MSKKIDRVGEVSYTKYGTKAIVVDYKNNKEITIEFQDEHKYRYVVTYMQFKNREIFNPFDKSIYGIGYIGVGKYNKISKNNKELNHCYTVWTKMIYRCYMPDLSRTNKQASYEKCEVCNDWLCFQNFADWYFSNKYDCCGEPLNIDKDILFHKNKLYSPETCLLVPRRINLLFIKGESIRGDLPIGVSYYWHDNSRYLASMKIGDRKSVQFGIFNTIDEAFQAYKNGKEQYIKQIADKYIAIIPQKVYDALVNYKVLITD